MSRFHAPVSELMSSPVIEVGIDDEIGRAYDLLCARLVSAVLVVNRAGAPAGVLSRRDLLRARRITSRGLELPPLTAADLMSRPVIAVLPAATLAGACHALVEHRIHRVFIVEGERSVGVFSTRQALTAVRDARLDLPLDRLVTRDLVTVETTTPLQQAIETMEAAGVGGVVVLEGTAPVGLLTEREVLEARGRPGTIATEEVMTQALLCLPGSTPLFRAAGFALATTARRIVVTDRHHAKGVVTGIDFARVVSMG